MAICSSARAATLGRCPAQASVVGEVEPADPIEDEIVRRDERRAVATVVERVERAGPQIDHLDAACGGRGKVAVLADGEAGEIGWRQTAVVGDVAATIRADRGAVRAQPNVRDQTRFTLGRNAGELASEDLHTQQPTTRGDDRALREEQAFGQRDESHLR